MTDKVNGTLLMLQAANNATNDAIEASIAAAAAGVVASNALMNTTNASASMIESITQEINELAANPDNDGNLTPQNQTYISTAQITAGTVNTDTNSITSMLQNLIDVMKSFLSNQNSTLNNINQTATNALAPVAKVTQCMG